MVCFLGVCFRFVDRLILGVIGGKGVVMFGERFGLV